MRSLITAMLFCLASCTPESSAPPPDPSGPTAAGLAASPSARRFLEVEGRVTLDGAPAAVGSAFGDTSRIETGERSRALITVQPGSVIEIRERSTLRLQSSARHKTSIELVAGVLWSILPKGQADYEVVTSNAVAGVRGTTFYIDATVPGRSMLCLCQGAVDLALPAGAPRALHTGGEHTGYKIEGEGAAAQVQQIGTAMDMDNHPNARREQLRALAP